MLLVRPFALFISWTCYGNWLPGDPRGHVSNRLSPVGGFEQKQNSTGTPFAEGDEYTHKRAKALQEFLTIRLTREQAGWAAEAIVEAAPMARHPCRDHGKSHSRRVAGLSPRRAHSSSNTERRHSS